MAHYYTISAIPAPDPDCHPCRKPTISFGRTPPILLPRFKSQSTAFLFFKPHSIESHLKLKSLKPKQHKSKPKLSNPHTTLKSLNQSNPIFLKTHFSQISSPETPVHIIPKSQALHPQSNPIGPKTLLSSSARGKKNRERKEKGKISKTTQLTWSS